MKIIDLVLKYLAGFSLLIIGAVVIFLLFVGFMVYTSPACKNEEALAFAKTVNNETWEKIYYESKTLLANRDPTKYEYRVLPDNISELNPVHVTSHGDSLWIYLSTCGLDDKVIVYIETSDKFENEVRIGWGDPVQSLIVWKKT